MNPFSAILTLLLGINAAYDLRRNMRESKEAKRRKAFERAGRERIRHAVHQLERLGGRGTRVKAGVDDIGELTLVVLRWPRNTEIPLTYMGYPVLEPAS